MAGHGWWVVLDVAFAEIAGLVSEAVGGPYHAATLTYPGTPVKDDGGSIVTPGTTVVVACKAQVDVATEAMRQAEGFLSEDVRLLIIGVAALDTKPQLALSAGPFAGKVYAILSAGRDPLGFGWECRGRAV